MNTDVQDESAGKVRETLDRIEPRLAHAIELAREGAHIDAGQFLREPIPETHLTVTQEFQAAQEDVVKLRRSWLNTKLGQSYPSYGTLGRPSPEIDGEPHMVELLAVARAEVQRCRTMLGHKAFVEMHGRYRGAWQAVVNAEARTEQLGDEWLDGDG
jgi:hypothetical protein